MRIKKITCYQFNELSDEAKENAINNCRDWNVNYDWWNNVYYNDAEENSGLKITAFNIDRGSYVDADFIISAENTIEKILKNHGKNCETYKTALEYKKQFDALDTESENYDDKYCEIRDEFLKALQEDYRIILQNEYEYLSSDEAIIEMIESNSYEFDEEGNVI